MTHWTVVSHPGPIEREVLASLAPAITRRRHIGSGITLRTLEGGTGSTIVFLHGRGHAASTWAPILAKLVANHHVMAFDLPGFGHSASRPWTGGGARDGLAFFAEPIGRALGELSEPPIVVGHSLGGAVALAATLAKHVTPRALVLVGAMGFSPRVRPRARLYYATDPERWARMRAPIRGLVEAASGRHATRAEALRRELLTVRGGRPDAAAAFRAMCPLVGEPLHFTRDELTSITQPTLLIWGDRDEAFPLDVAQSAARTLPHAELRVLAAGHSPHVEKAEDVARLIEGFAISLERADRD